MEKQNYTHRNRGAAAFLAVLMGILSPLAAGAQEAAVASQGSALTPAADAVDFAVVEAVIDSPAAFERNPVLSGIHLGLGWATVAAGLATGILNPEVVGEDVHAALGISSAALAASTMLFGFIAHYGEVGPKFKLSANNVHALLGAAGGIMMMIAPFVAPTDAHKVLGEGGALLMGVSIGWKLVF
jgi:hypothetical protein